MTAQGRKFTGWHFLLIICGAFGTVVTANLTLAYFALGSFPGLDVANTYVASQQFDAKRQAQQALGWTGTVSYQEGRIAVSLRGPDGTNPTPQTLRLRIGSATTNREDRTVIPQLANGLYVAAVPLTAGKKTVFIDAVAADGTAFSQRHSLVVP